MKMFCLMGAFINFSDDGGCQRRCVSDGTPVPDWFRDTGSPISRNSDNCTAYHYGVIEDSYRAANRPTAAVIDKAAAKEVG
jgi:hypothetical protein